MPFFILCKHLIISYTASLQLLKKLVHTDSSASRWFVSVSLNVFWKFDLALFLVLWANNKSLFDFAERKKFVLLLLVQSFYKYLPILMRRGGRYASSGFNEALQVKFTFPCSPLMDSWRPPLVLYINEYYCYHCPRTDTKNGRT